MKSKLICLLLVAFIFPNLSLGNQCLQLFAKKSAKLLEVDFASLLDIANKATEVYDNLFKKFRGNRDFQSALHRKFIAIHDEIPIQVHSFEVNSRTVREELVVPLADLISRAHDARTDAERNEAHLDLVAAWTEILLKINKAIYTLRHGVFFNAAHSKFELDLTNLGNDKSFAIHQILTEIWIASANYRLDASFINQLAESLDRGSLGIAKEILDELGINYLRVIVEARQKQLKGSFPYRPSSSGHMDVT